MTFVNSTRTEERDDEKHSASTCSLSPQVVSSACNSLVWFTRDNPDQSFQDIQVLESFIFSVLPDCVEFKAVRSIPHHRSKSRRQGGKKFSYQTRKIFYLEASPIDVVLGSSGHQSTFVIDDEVEDLASWFPDTCQPTLTKLRQLGILQYIR